MSKRLRTRDAINKITVAPRETEVSEADIPDGGLVEKADILHELTKEPRPRLIYDILGHPQGMVSMREFEYYNPSLKRNTIQYHLDRLVEIGIVEKHKLPKGERKRDLPSTFYALSGEGRRFLDRHNLLAEETVWQEIHENVEKTTEIRKIESMPRP